MTYITSEDKQIIYASLTETCRMTGLSTFYLRNGCKNNSVPHIMSGKKYLVNVPALLKKLENDSMSNADRPVNSEGCTTGGKSNEVHS